MLTNEDETDQSDPLELGRWDDHANSSSQESVFYVPIKIDLKLPPSIHRTG